MQALALAQTKRSTTAELTAPPSSASAGAGSTASNVIYFSSVSDNTHRFVRKLGVDSARLPLYTSEETLLALKPFVLILPTYGGETGHGAVPKQVIKFLNVGQNRALIRGVIGAGNTNFGETYCLAGDVIAAKCRVPLLYRFELMGTSVDVDRVNQGLDTFWTRLLQHRP
ncbi:class Ib ribonucleoside-diphosphate reductase assembly flavoprotein NrdI [Paenarthrobacter sp. PH39-S1]|uniref:class Ib ribonucleoside-diphosphate reductase assembly flavoprotein NrdI n=1 Tax=Paenarthrobacter sp. PH39-S1 TaxID=3046204 RepID=UPI0024B92A92|nr:class Ib ribonucleoside-diphosphate reductase assembly flavoprotein NrdI [Paenarthrobacter sp. PH39-S1]MDJ0355425.1 class Ib ribonucleoside-diphosphate reductase assembly flavoprotein NrdI [Paenarthrobacter sp. PH39-S1]